MAKYEIELDDGSKYEIETQEPLQKAKSSSLVKDIPAIGSEFLSGALADAPRNIPERPLATAIGGPSLAQMQVGANVPTLISNLLRGRNQPVPFPEEQRQLPQILPTPQTEAGKILGFGANVLGGVFGAPGRFFAKTATGTGEAIASRMAGGKKVKQIQEAFFPFQKAATERFGEGIKKGTEALIKSNKPVSVSAKEMEAVMSPIKNAVKEANIPRVAKSLADNVADTGIEQILRQKAMLRRSLSAAERTGKVVTDRSRAIGEAIKNIDGAIRSRIPDISKYNQEYAVFSRIKEFLEKFEPGLAKLPGSLGTSKGEKLLRGIFNMTEEEISILKKFENASNLKIVDPARKAATIRTLMNAFGRVAPFIIGFEALKRSGAPKEVFNILDASA